MKIERLALENFQGIRALTLDLGGNSATIYGDNATGKTTVYNAITWILFDKAANGAKNYNPKPRTAEGEAHNVESVAEMLISAENGEKMTLKKVFKEVYKKKNGSLSAEFSGHTVDYYIDGIPVKEREYTGRVLELFGNNADIPKLLTSPEYFPSLLPWDERRKLLVDIVGDVTDSDIIAADPELAELDTLLNIPNTSRRYTVDDLKKIAAAKKTDVNKRLLMIPARIDEARKAIPEIREKSAEKLREEISEIDELIKHTAEKGESIDHSELDRLTAEKERLRSAYLTEARKANAEIEERITAAQVESRNAVVDWTRAKNSLTEMESECRSMEKRREELCREHSDVVALRFSEQTENCPTCHRRLPEEKVSELHANFEEQKKKRIKDINTRGAEVSRDKIAELKEKIEHQKQTVAELETAYAEKSALVKELGDKICAPAPFELTAECANITAMINAESDRLRVIRSAVEEDQERRKADLLNLKARKESLESDLAAIRIAATQSARIGELEAEEKRLGIEFLETERTVYLCDRFTRAKVDALNGKINACFESVRFRLFDEQINGGLKDICDVMIPTADGTLVPYQYANHAAQVNAGLEIIDTLSRYFGVTAPVIVDNAESVTAIRPTATQCIRLVVSEADKELRCSL